MAYALDTVTPSDHEKILADAAASPEKQKWVARAIAGLMFSDTWAIDRERNHYLICMPNLVRTESRAQPYLAFVEGRMYTVVMSSDFSQDLYFDEENPPSGDEGRVVEKEITAAFAAHGRYGLTASNKGDVPEIVPVFHREGA